MRVELKISGGFGYFPGLARPLVVDAAQLPREASAQLRELCASAIAQAGAAKAGTPAAVPAAPLPDARTYSLTIADADGTRELTCADPIGKGPLSELVAFVQDHGVR